MSIQNNIDSSKKNVNLDSHNDLNAKIQKVDNIDEQLEHPNYDAGQTI